MTDLERSERLIASILKKLRESGARRIDLDRFSLPELQEWDDFELFSDCMIWLRDEGIVRVHSITDDAVHLCCLTAYGYNLLGRKINFSGEDASVEDVLSKVEAGAGQYVRAGSFLGGLLGGFTKSIG